MSTRPMYWSIRRELWENRSLYIAPLTAAGVVLFGYAIRAITLAHRMREVAALDPARQSAAVALPYSVAASLIILTTYIVGVFYCLDALHGERRDRSILFWKSLPVSDRTTVLSKASIPFLVLPLLAFAIIIVTQLVMLLLSTVVLLASPSGLPTLWANVPLFQGTVVLVYGLTVHALWHAPLYAWLLFLSVWARRVPFLWALLPPLGLMAFERIAFQSSHVASLVKYRLVGAMKQGFALRAGDDDILRVSQLDPLRLLATPGLWIGLGAAALFLAAAARVRRNRAPI